MNYIQHAVANIIIAALITIAGLFSRGLIIDRLPEMWLAVLIYTFIITCDLDSEKSIVRRLWGPLKFIWSPFCNFGHREALHHVFWGPYILVSFLWIPLTVKGISVSNDAIFGAVLALENHILFDYLYSNGKKVIKIVKKPLRMLHLIK